MALTLSYHGVFRPGADAWAWWSGEGTIGAPDGRRRRRGPRRTAAGGDRLVVELLFAAPSRRGVRLTNVVAYMLHRMKATADPTFGMLQRILRAAQADLDVTAQPLPTLSLARLSDAWFTTRWGGTIDWTSLRAALDELALHPDALESAIATPPPRSGNARLDSLLAALAEKMADDAGLPRPAWCGTVPALAEPWKAPGTPRMVARAAANAPEQFRRRNILLSEAELWQGLSERVG